MIAQRRISEYSIVVDTRLQGLQEAVTSGRAETQAQRLFALLIEAGAAGMTNNELVRRSGFPINAVTARMVELRRVELSGGELLVESFGMAEDPVTGMPNAVWRINPAYFEPSRRLVR